MHDFFLSYAWTDRLGEPHIKSFRDKLAEEVRRIRALPAETRLEDIGFLDDENIPLGARWREALVTSLWESRVLVSLLSPGLYQSDYCGREWQLFAQHPRAAELMLPVIWEDPKYSVSVRPQAVDDLQLKSGKYSDVYRQNGLRFLFQNQDRMAAEITAFVHELAGTIVQRGTGVAPVGGNATEALRTTADAFADYKAKVKLQEQGTVGAGVPAQEPHPALLGTRPRGPKVAYQIVVAGIRSEMTRVKQLGLDCYGEDGYWEWCPYLPEVDLPLQIRIANAIIAERFTPDTCPLHPDLGRYLRKAEQDGTMVLLVVDNWTLWLEDYKAVIERLDQENYRGFGVVVVRNPKDPDVAKSSADLEDLVEFALGRTRTKKDYFIVARDERDLLQKTRKLLVRLNAEVRKGRAPRTNGPTSAYAQVPRPGG